MFAVLLEVLQGPICTNTIVAEQAMRTVGDLAVRDDSSRRLGAAGVCKGECILCR